MDIIHLLPDSVANQIAAGEVVQRPASVIKELLENSIDAGATEIQIILRQAGKELIRVIDNGKGMSPTDARMAFERHATSKITQASDLFNLHTMGFRGEALASIVAVAEVEMRTRRPEDEAGILLRMAGSKLEKQETVACALGTSIEVRNIFYNVPARRKFLKSDSTELSNIITEIQHVALANAQVGFTLIHEEKPLFQWTAGSLKQRIVQMFKNMEKQLLPIEMKNELLNISGFVGTPEGAKKKGASQFFFVNDRFMKHPYFHKAIMECYQGLISEDSQPNYFVYLQVDPASIDVNIHPTKTEIEFQNKSERWHILMATVKEALGKFNAVPAIDFDQADAPEIEVFSDPNGAPMPAEPKVNIDRSYNPFRSTSVMEHWQTLYDDFQSDRQSSTLPSRMSGGIPVQQEVMPEPEPEVLPSRLSTVFDDVRLPEGVNPKEAAKDTYRKYLQVAGRYIVTSSRDGLILIDQRRAHEAVLYDRYYHLLANRKGLSQTMLMQEIVEFPPADVPIVEQIMPQLGGLGFELSNLGGGSFAVTGIPASLDRGVDYRALLLQMVDAARDEVHGLSEALDRKLALRMAQVESIHTGKSLSEEEMVALVDELYALPDHTIGPDGKRIATQLKVADLQKLF